MLLYETSPEDGPLCASYNGTDGKTMDVGDGDDDDDEFGVVASFRDLALVTICE